MYDFTLDSVRSRLKKSVSSKREKLQKWLVDCEVFATISSLYYCEYLRIE